MNPLLLLMPAVSRMHGIGEIEVPADASKWFKLYASICNKAARGFRVVSTAVFCIAFAVAAYLAHGLHFWLIGALAAGFGIATGHGNVYEMKGVNPEKDEPEQLEAIVRPIFKRFGWSIYKPAYSWAVMGLKGLIIGLGAFPAGLLLAFLWPAGYFVGSRLKPASTAVGEWLGGLGAAIVLILAM